MYEDDGAEGLELVQDASEEWVSEIETGTVRHENEPIWVEVVHDITDICN